MQKIFSDDHLEVFIEEYQEGNELKKCVVIKRKDGYDTTVKVGQENGYQFSGNGTSTWIEVTKGRVTELCNTNPFVVSIFPDREKT